LGLIVFRAWADHAVMTFLPKFYQAQGWDPASYGLAASAFFLGQAVGIVVGGPLAERWGRRLILSTSFLAVAPFLVLLPYAPGLSAYPLVLLIGLLLGLSFSAVIVLGQTLLPGGKGTASGLVMGLRFASGAVGSIITGWVADATSLAFALQALAIVVVITAVCGRLLPSTRTVAQP
jgi:FSR family fosmidomycin resistance protein-like MFS transporter